jgi:hypothetical protein
MRGSEKIRVSFKAFNSSSSIQVSTTIMKIGDKVCELFNVYSIVEY